VRDARAGPVGEDPPGDGLVVVLVGLDQLERRVGEYRG
jgi:hypothetical protein